MKKYAAGFRPICLIVLIFFNVQLVMGKDTGREAETKSDSLMNNGLQFTFINSLSAAYKMRTNAGNYWRFGISLEGSYNENNHDRNHLEQWSSDTTESAIRGSGNNKTMFIALTVDHIWNIVQYKMISFYLGVGPRVYYGAQKGNSEWQNVDVVDGTKRETYSSTKTIFLGIRGVAGIESTIYGNLSLFAEIYATAGKEWYSFDQEYNSGNEYRSAQKVKGQQFSAGISNIKIGLNVYF